MTTVNEHIAAIKAQVQHARTVDDGQLRGGITIKTEAVDAIIAAYEQVEAERDAYRAEALEIADVLATTQAAVAAQAAMTEQMRAALDEMSTPWNGIDNSCPYCGAYPKEQHAADCKIGRALALTPTAAEQQVTALREAVRDWLLEGYSHVFIGSPTTTMTLIRAAEEAGIDLPTDAVKNAVKQGMAERRVCRTCANWDRESPPSLGTNDHRCRVHGCYWGPDDGCTRHEPASEEAGT